jgi:RES domain-containing protein
VIAWRLCSSRFPPLTGEGARLAGGRWNEKGTRMVYCSESLSLAALESFVHFDSSLLPDDFVFYELEIPDDVAVTRFDTADLPKDWAAIPGPTTLQSLGSAWLRARSSAVLIVPSAVVEREHNILLNPDHPDFHKIAIGVGLPFVFDTRLKKSPSTVAKPPSASGPKTRKRAARTVAKPHKKPLKRRSKK